MAFIRLFLLWLGMAMAIVYGFGPAVTYAARLSHFHFQAGPNSFPFRSLLVLAVVFPALDIYVNKRLLTHSQSASFSKLVIHSLADLLLLPLSIVLVVLYQNATIPAPVNPSSELLLPISSVFSIGLAITLLLIKYFSFAFILINRRRAYTKQKEQRNSWGT